ncbi:Riboflavin biosynthesis protein RibF [bacterium HR26]|nr:Riboflavin biosynthesis protein RibF [bacterium HR26]
MPALLYRALSELPRQPHALTIGNFDGVHRGHQYLLGRLRERAAEQAVRSLVLTFDPLPAEVLRPQEAPPRLCTLEERVALIGACYIDAVLVLQFDEEFARQTPEAFIEQVVRAAAPVELVVGDDFRFGRGRSGSVDTLRELGVHYGFDVTVVPRVDLDTEPISSTRIRELVSAGSIEIAAELLGRPYSLTGDVIEGHRRGQLLGYPTANLRLIDRLAVPADGIYVVQVSIDGSPGLLPGMAYIGTRPVFQDQQRAIEVHLLDVTLDLYERRLTVLFVRRLRGDMWFPSVDALIEQMKADERATREILANLGEGWPPPLTWAILNLAEGAVSADG